MKIASVKKIGLSSLISVTFAVMVSGCANDPDDISAKYVSSAAYSTHNCSQLMIENNRVCQRIDELHTLLRTKARKDVVKTTAGVLLTPLILFSLDGKNSPESIEYSQLKGSFEAIQIEASSKHCKMATFMSPKNKLMAAKNMPTSKNKDKTTI